ncbi:hypothetical protein [Mucilaginibacter ginsenosidivorans]|uniref:Secreted protein n=1 Tax=Mucilaginibacter ginsenosidivorans TaxID=398053 RepID=A0A5B8UVW0_9SPHI|nr:hypothetical protein [Mucilaginibacter ginsenosidivorans]QEC62471.1 hypothetical protein FRZ54_07680 [Mucilaginibacter ginsenosidivorans]
MKKQNHMSRVIAALKVLLTFGAQHAASLEASKKPYTRSWLDQPSGDRCSVKLAIHPMGHLFEVILTYFVNDQYKVTEKWPATYGWHSNGHLIAIGRTAHIIFDPARKLVLVENIPGNGPVTIDIYHEA